MTQRKSERQLFNPFILQELFTSQRIVDKYLSFIDNIIFELSKYSYIEKREFRDNLVTRIREKVSLGNKDLSKLTNDLMRLGIIVGAEVTDNSIRVTNLKAAYNAKYVALSESAKRVTKANEYRQKLYAIAKSYAQNIAVNSILRQLVNTMDEDTLIVRIDVEEELNKLTRTAAYAIMDIVEPNNTIRVKLSPTLSNELKKLAEKLIRDRNMKQRFIKGFIKPLSMLTMNEAIQFEQKPKTIILNKSILSKLLEEEEPIEVGAIVRAYCEIIKELGYENILGEIGPEVPVRALAEYLHVPFDKLLSNIIEITKYSDELIYEIGPAFDSNDINRHLIRIKKDILKKCCKII